MWDWDAQGREVTTIEGLALDEELHPLQRSFLEKGAVQCGFCTPAMILSAKALLDKNPSASEEEIKQALSGVLCRCGSYQKILEAVRAARDEAGGGVQKW
jgi:carbon-monoxide dehydrogenase small subunit